MLIPFNPLPLSVLLLSSILFLRMSLPRSNSSVHFCPFLLKYHFLREPHLNHPGSNNLASHISSPFLCFLLCFITDLLHEMKLFVCFLSVSLECKPLKGRGCLSSSPGLGPVNVCWLTSVGQRCPAKTTATNSQQWRKQRPIGHCRTAANHKSEISYQENLGGILGSLQKQNSRQIPSFHVFHSFNISWTPVQIWAPTRCWVLC